MKFTVNWLNAAMFWNTEPKVALPNGLVVAGAPALPHGISVVGAVVPQFTTEREKVRSDAARE